MIKNILSEETIPRMLKVLRGTIDANKEPLFLRVGNYYMAYIH